MVNDKYQFIIVIVILLLVIAAIIVLIFFGDDIFETGETLASKSQPELAKKGYGTYKSVYESPCITTNGKCNTAGVKYKTEYCEPHPVSGNGCINEKGEQTFNARSTSETCIPNCRSFILQEVTNFNNFCSYDPPYNQPAYTCIPPNAQAYEYRNYTCVKNDSIGDNTCTYKCGSAGVDSAGLNGDVDSTKESFIPFCVNNPNQSIILNSLPWNNINSLDPKGVTMSKGYTITNLKLPNGQVDPKNFSISPAYPAWGPNPSTTISYEDLYALDTTLTVYDNCVASNPKPLCDNYYYAKPIEPGSNLSNQPIPKLCQLDGSFQQTKNCFYHPWYNTGGQGLPPGNTGLNYINPYTKENAGLTGQVYSWVGIGNYGYYATPLLCESTPEPLVPSGNTGEYIIPSKNTGVQANSVCLNLSAPPQQCSNDYTGIFSVVPSAPLSNLIAEFEQGTYNPPTTGVYPQPINSTNYLCNAIYPNGINTLTPGCIQTCQYLPSYTDIDFTAADFNGNYIDVNIQNLLGRYISLNVESPAGKTYFLGTENVPCKNNSNQGIPLGNCLNPSSGASGYNPTLCTFVYNGGTGINAGQYWSKNGCDDESIELASNMRIIVSPSSVYDTLVPGATGSSIICDLYAYIDGIFGYLSLENNGNTGISTLNITPYFHNYGDLSNIVANFQTTNTVNVPLYFNALPLGEPIPRTSTNLQPQFILSYDSMTSLYTLSSTNPNIDNITLDSYDGTVYNSQAFNFQFTTELNATVGTPYYKTLDFEAPIIKTSGIYAGSDVTRTITLQRTNQCYTYNTCHLGFTSDVCYTDTCNLYYKYNPEYCG